MNSHLTRSIQDEIGGITGQMRGTLSLLKYVPVESMRLRSHISGVTRVTRLKINCAKLLQFQTLMPLSKCSIRRVGLVAYTAANTVAKVRLPCTHLHNCCRVQPLI